MLKEYVVCLQMLLQNRSSIVVHMLHAYEAWNELVMKALSCLFHLIEDWAWCVIHEMSPQVAELLVNFVGKMLAKEQNQR